MSENELFEKTKKVANKQQELSDLINELKSEVKDVYFENKELTEENILLRQKLSFFERNKKPSEEPVVVKTPIEIEKPVESVKPDQQVKVEPVPVVAPKPAPVITKERVPKESNALLEFFLGNIYVSIGKNF